MCIKKCFAFFGFLFGVAALQDAAGQEIKGDTIYSSTTQLSSLFFPAAITSCDYADAESYKRFQKRIENSMVTIIAKSNNATPAALKLVEGKRTHYFFIVYKPELSPAELEHDWSNLKDLKNYVAALAKKPVSNTSYIATAPVEVPIISQAEPMKETSVVKQEVIEKTPPAEKNNKQTTIEKEPGYDETLYEAYRLYEKKEYTQAKILYEKAAALKPGEKIAHNKIADIDALLAEKEKKDALEKELAEKEAYYKAKRILADQSFEAKNFEEAKANYSLAITARPNDAYVLKRLTETQRKLDGLERSRKINELEEQYKKSIGIAKKEYGLKNYEDAKAAYAMAADLKPADPFARNQLKAIGKIIEENEKQQKAEKLKQEKLATFKEAIAIGNDAYNSNNLSSAVVQYRKAISIMPDPYAEDQLKRIAVMLADSTRKLKEEQVRLEKEKQNLVVYKLNIDKADKAFENKDYQGARKWYTQALTYKDDAYPKKQLTDIQSALIKMAADNEVNKKYDLLVSKAKASLKNNDYNNGRIYLEDAVTVKPGDQFAKDQLDLVYKKLDELAKEKERQDKYDAALTKAAQNITNPELAISFYKEANDLIPSETYPPKMIASLQSQLAKKAADLEEQKRRQGNVDRITNIRGLLNNAEAAIAAKQWQPARSLYEEVLSLQPTKADQDFAQKKIVTIDLELARIALKTPVKKDTIVVATSKKRRQRASKPVAQKGAAGITRAPDVPAKALPVPAVVAAKASPEVQQTNAVVVNTVYQEEAIPYTQEELAKKYPAIRFDELPAGQTSNPAGRKNRSLYYQVSLQTAAEAPRLNLYDSIAGVKVTCQSITFHGSGAYIKLLIQNYSNATDFLTGPVQLRLLKKKGAPQELPQMFVSDFPLVKPRKAFVMVYVADASVAVAANDLFVMEVSDRGKKTKLKINIEGEVYNREKQLYSKN